MKTVLAIFFTIVFIQLFFSCKKDAFITSPNASLRVSADSIKFDTVFTTTGSVTKSFKIFNNNSLKLKLDKVKLMGGSSSPFKINIDGIGATELNNIEIAPQDSIYVFVSVTINPNVANLPFIVSDSISITYNGNTRFVQLQAFGQNANFLGSTVISANTTWANNLPYVIIGGLRIDTTATLTIQPGCKIYSHADAPFIIDGTLIINGAKDNEVVFAGDRLDADYKDFPAGWPGIYFRGSSSNNQISFAVVKNAYQGIVVQDPSINTNPKLILHQIIINNAYDAGLRCINTSLEADNCLITNCGSNIAIELGGDYIFTHCTAASFSNIYFLHKIPVLSVSNFASQNGITVFDDLNAIFRNCIFWGDNGNVENEVVINKKGTGIFNVNLDHCLYKIKDDPLNTTIIAPVKNQYPQFDSIDVSNNYFDFRVSNPLAPGIDKGILSIFTKDLDNNNRNNGQPDLGSYEKQ